jgi:hypothetical protein
VSALCGVVRHAPDDGRVLLSSEGMTCADSFGQGGHIRGVSRIESAREQSPRNPPLEYPGEPMTGDIGISVVVVRRAIEALRGQGTLSPERDFKGGTE